MSNKSVISWSIEEVCVWIHNKFPDYEENFRSQEIKGIDLLTLTREELRDDLLVDILGHRKMILREIEELKGTPESAETNKFVSLLKIAGVEPEYEVMNKLLIHMAAQVNAIGVYGLPETALHLYEQAKLLIGTTTRIQIQHNINISINGPLNVDLYGPKIFSGADAEGRPIVIKVIRTQVSNEINAIRALKLNESNNLPLVCAQIHSIHIRDEDSLTTRLMHCVIMPHYPTSVALLPQLPAKVLLAGANIIQSALEYIHSSNYCHLDSANIFVDTDGKWILGDFDTTVPTCTTVIGHTNAYILRNYKEQPAKPAMDYYMLATTILMESNKTGPNNVYSRIRGPDGFAVHSRVLQEIEIMSNSDLKSKVQELLTLAADICN